WCLASDNQTFLAALTRLHNIQTRRSRTGGDRAKKSFNLLQNLPAFYVSDYYEGRVSRVITFVVVRLHIGARRGFEVFQPTYCRPMIRMLSESCSPDLVFKRLPGTIQPDPQFFFDHLFFGSKFFLSEGSVAHAACLDFKRCFPTIR